MTSQHAASSPGLRTALGHQSPGARPNLERANSPRTALLRLAGYFVPERHRLVLVALSVVAYTLLGLCGPYLMGHAIDHFIARKTTDGLAQTALLMLAAYVASNVLQVASNWWMAGASARALQQLRGQLFSHLQRLPMVFFDQRPSGELMSRLTNDIDAIGQAVSQNITALLASVLSMVGIVIAMFVLDVWLALASLLVLPIMFWCTRSVAVYTRRGFRDVQRTLGGLNGVMEETIAGQRVIKAFRRNDAAFASFRDHNAAVYRASVVANTYALLLMPLISVLGNLYVIVIAGLGGFLALRGLVTVGVIAAFVNYAQNFVNPLRQLSNLYNTIQAALAGAERVFDTLDQAPELDAASGVFPEPSSARVCFDHVRFGYRPGVVTIQDLSLCAEPGQVVALVGPTGAGKTTIVNLLTRFYEIDAGRITIGDVDIRSMSKRALRQRLGIVLQDTFLFANTVLENIRYGEPGASDEEVIEAARLADADHFIRALPDGYRTMLSERASNLSQGQRQLLAIARTLLADPAILILDEATSSVDTRTEARIQKALLRLMHGRTSFVIAHRLSTIRDADQVLVIRDGALVERGTHQELIARHGFYQQLFVSQFKGQAL